MIPDVIVCWPRFADYPLWRKWIAAERGWFGQVFVVFTDHSGADISDWVRTQFGPTIRCLDSYADGKDWRDTAVNMALDCSNSEWVWFTEQDLFIHEPGRFWAEVDDAATRNEVIGWWDLGGERLHPSCLFATRAAIERTTRYFGTPPIDHFWTFTQDLKRTGATIHTLWPGMFEHLAGLTQNHFLIDCGVDEGISERARFRSYLRDCLNSGVELEPGWRERAEREVA